MLIINSCFIKKINTANGFWRYLARVDLKCHFGHNTNLSISKVFCFLDSYPSCISSSTYHYYVGQVSRYEGVHPTRGAYDRCSHISDRYSQGTLEQEKWKCHQNPDAQYNRRFLSFSTPEWLKITKSPAYWTERLPCGTALFTQSSNLSRIPWWEMPRIMHILGSQPCLLLQSTCHPEMPSALLPSEPEIPTMIVVASTPPLLMKFPTPSEEFGNLSSRCSWYTRISRSCV